MSHLFILFLSNRNKLKYLVTWINQKRSSNVEHDVTSHQHPIKLRSGTIFPIPPLTSHRTAAGGGLQHTTNRRRTSKQSQADVRKTRHPVRTKMEGKRTNRGKIQPRFEEFDYKMRTSTVQTQRAETISYSTRCDLPGCPRTIQKPPLRPTVALLAPASAGDDKSEFPGTP